MLRNAKGEIEQLINYDFMNDCKNEEIDIYRNFFDTNYTACAETKQELKKKLKKAKIEFEDLSIKTQWFLD